jgi:N-acetylmuramoyl-L-alanine amidase
LLSHNDRVLIPGEPTVGSFGPAFQPGTVRRCVLGPLGFSIVVALAGCAAPTPRAHVSGWESEDLRSPAVTVVPAPAIFAPAPAPDRPTPVAASNRFTETWISLPRWCAANGLAGPDRFASVLLPVYTINTTHGAFTLRMGSQVAQWNGLEVRLGFAPQLIDGQPFIHSLDARKTIEPLIQGTWLAFPISNRVVVIDPGHGGEDVGTRSVAGGRFEKEFTLDWARRLEALLATNGWRVFLTHGNDTDMALSNRVTFAESHKADVFVSLHFNSAAPNQTEAGLETYCLTPSGMYSAVTRGFADDPAQAFPNNAFDAQNLQLASVVHRALLQANGNRDRGVRRARCLGVLRGQHCPGILVEGGYLSNPEEARRIATPAYRQKLAEAVAQALNSCVQRQT